MGSLGEAAAAAAAAAAGGGGRQGHGSVVAGVGIRTRGQLRASASCGSPEKRGEEPGCSPAPAAARQPTAALPAQEVRKNLGEQFPGRQHQVRF